MFSVATYALVCWYQSATSCALRPLEQALKQGSRLTGTIHSLQDTHQKRMGAALERVLDDSGHVLCQCFERLPSGRLRAMQQKRQDMATPLFHQPFACTMIISADDRKEVIVDFYP